MKKLTLILSAMFFHIFLQAYECRGEVISKNHTPPAKTKYEKFISADGQILVREFYKLNSPLHLNSYLINLDTKLIKVTSVNNNKTIIGLQFRYTKKSKYALTFTNILDEDEILSLSKALAYMQKNVTKMSKNCKTYTEVEYASRGGFKAGFYIIPQKNKNVVSYYMIIRGKLVSLPTLSGLATTIKDSENMLKEIKSN